MRILNRESLIAVYDRLTGLVEKLPGGLQKPILKELLPIRQLFLDHRAARLFLVGSGGGTTREILSAMGVPEVELGGPDNGWRPYRVPTLGAVEILDGRDDIPGDLVEAGLRRYEPDVVLFFGDELDGGEAWDRAVNRAATLAAPVIGIASVGEAAFRLQARLAAERSLSRRVPKVLDLKDPACDEIICAALPFSAQLEFARVTGARRAQAHIAGSLLKSFSAVCGVIAVQPIPLADMPILTTLQTLMVGLIIHTTGKPFSPRLVAEFIGALGFNIGAGLVLREGARALVRFVPVWGNAVSGFVAGAGTYAIGRAAIAYFIEESPIEETRKLFKRLLPKRNGSVKPPELPPA